VNVKSYAQQRELSQSKVRDLAKELFGSVPTVFSDDQIKQLDSSLLKATLAITSSPESEIPAELVADTHTPQVIEIVGSREIQKNLLQYLQLLKRQYDVDTLKAETAVFQAEQAFYNKLASHQMAVQSESSARITRNSQLWHSEGIKSLSPVNQEEEDILAQINELLEFINA
jgi:hypothetical protein